jgi:hypothetical protein
MSSYVYTAKPRTPEDLTIADIQDTTVCGPCGDVVGRARHRHERGFVMVQTGTCDVHTGPAEPRWPRKDFNRFVELCRCCGTVPLHSGSKWAVWFCPACNEQVGLLNQRLGRYAIPIGRHSVHAGRLLPAEADPVAVHTFLESMNASFEAMGVLQEWAHEVIRLNLRAIREDDDSLVPIAAYCQSAQKHVDPFDRFREMCAWLGQQGREAGAGEERA